MEARDAQLVLDHQETERANAPYEREKWAMPFAAWHVVRLRRDAHIREVARLRDIGQETEARRREERRLHDIDSRQLQRWRLQAGWVPAVTQSGWDYWDPPNTSWATSSWWQTPWNPDDGDWWTPTAGDHAGLYHAASVHPAVVPAKGKGKCKGATYQPALQPPRGDHTARLDPWARHR